MTLAKDSHHTTSDRLGIDLAGEALQLLPNGGVYWPSRGILFVADLHLGKANHFRKHGIAVPLNVQNDNLGRLEHAIHLTDCSDVFFLGDLFHSSVNESWTAFAKLCAGHAHVTFHLVEGNHDILDEDAYDSAGIRVWAEGLIVGPFELAHHPQDQPGQAYRLCGHLHPAVRLRGKGRMGLRLPCFWQAPHQMILPAFGGFTGTHTIRPKSGDGVFVLSDHQVIDVTG